MLLRFRFSNMLSFRTEQELSFVAAMLTDKTDIPIQPTAVKEAILPVIGIYGANASGKTNVIRGLSFMCSAVEDSHRQWEPNRGIPRKAFGLNARARNQPSTFVVDFLLQNVRHEYGFVVDSQTVHQEWLYVYPNNKRQAWFVRTQGAPITFSSKMQGENRAIEALTRPNSLFLSSAAQNNHEALTPIYRWFSDRLDFIYADRTQLKNRTASLCADEAFRSTVSNILKHADLGIAAINVKQESMPDELKPAFKAFFSALKSESRIDEIADPTEMMRSTVEFLHTAEGEPVPFRFNQESHGTTAFLSLLGPALQALHQGSIVAIDELDAHLHPLLASRLIELFNSKQHNRLGAQLVFTTHDTNLFRALRRDQLWFTEKDHDGSSTLYPLTDFKPRRDESLQNGYLQGRYGAIPFIDTATFWNALDA